MSAIHMASPAPSVTVPAIHAVGGQHTRGHRRSIVPVTNNPAEVTCGICLRMLSALEAVTQ